jgi:hypothetical protein
MAHMIGWADRLEIQGRIGIITLSLKSTRQASRWETQSGFLYCMVEAELLLLGDTTIFTLKGFS